MKRNRASGLTDKEAQQLLRKLTKHYGQQVRPVGEYCAAFRTWFKVIQKKDEEALDAGETNLHHRKAYVESLGRLYVDITKSNLLARLIYAGEELRTEKCPIHKGSYAGGGSCVYGCDNTGWLKTPKLVGKFFIWAKKVTGLSDEEVIARGEAKNFAAPDYVGKGKGKYFLSTNVIPEWLYHLGRKDLIPESLLVHTQLGHRP